MTRSTLRQLAGLAALGVVLQAGCSTRKPPHTGPGQRGWQEKGIASWYGKPYDGRPTASGEIFDMHAMTAAHKTLPFGTRVRVVNLRNRRSVVVRINDRGPFKKGRVIDLSYGAAKKLRMIEAGIVPVRLRVD